jgi:hypothetical protein
VEHGDPASLYKLVGLDKESIKKVIEASQAQLREEFAKHVTPITH